MKKEREVLILPNQDYLNLDGLLKIPLNDNDRHGKAIKEFSDKYNIGLTFDLVGVQIDNYNGYMWGIALSKLGHISIYKDYYTIIYLPAEITKKQYQLLKECKRELEIYKNDIEFVSVKLIDNKSKIERYSKNNISNNEEVIDILYEVAYEKTLERGEHNVSRIKN